MTRVLALTWLCCCLPLVPEALAGQRCCDQCGCHREVKRICRPVCEMKEVKEPVYDCRCEDFCVPGPSQRHVCQGACGECEQEVWVPTCAGVRTRQVLIKREVTKQVPTIRWVVEYRCADCCRSHDEPCEAADPQAAAPQVAPPPRLARLPAPASRS